MHDRLKAQPTMAGGPEHHLGQRGPVFWEE
jgi:hypothetical protein